MTFWQEAPPPTPHCCHCAATRHAPTSAPAQDGEGIEVAPRLVLAVDTGYLGAPLHGLRGGYAGALAGEEDGRRVFGWENCPIVMGPGIL